MDKNQILETLKSLINEGRARILPTQWSSPEGIYYVDQVKFSAWHTKSLVFMKSFLPENNEYIVSFAKHVKYYYQNADTCIALLENVIDSINSEIIEVHAKSEFDSDFGLRKIFSRFHRIARQIRNRYDDRPTLDVNDEYDVQDLLHALLTLFFNDIRQEEWTPSYAGKSARMDFLLKNEKIVIEVKKTRKGLTEKELGDQLIIDVDRYRVHPDCRKLICFVYDPEGRIGNPEGLIRDFNEQHAGFVDIIIEPIY